MRIRFWLRGSVPHKIWEILKVLNEYFIIFVFVFILLVSDVPWNTSPDPVKFGPDSDPGL